MNHSPSPPFAMVDFPSIVNKFYSMIKKNSIIPIIYSYARCRMLTLNTYNMPNCQESYDVRQMNFSFFTASTTSGGKKFFHVCLIRVTKMPLLQNINWNSIEHAINAGNLEFLDDVFLSFSYRVVAPKSHSLMREKSNVKTKTFSNFKSRCTKFFECINPSAELNCVEMILTAISERPPEQRFVAKSPIKTQLNRNGNQNRPSIKLAFNQNIRFYE